MADGVKFINTDGEMAPPAQQNENDRRMQKTQAQVNEVVEIMRSNVEKIIESDITLNDIHSKTEALEEGAKRFEDQTGRLRRRYWWQNAKIVIIMGSLALMLLGIFMIWAFGGSSNSDSSKA